MMTAAYVILGWTALSLPLGMFVGKLIAQGQRQLEEAGPPLRQAPESARGGLFDRSVLGLADRPRATTTSLTK
jgi:hypothetical protein